jgi:hypothetical protein
MQQWLQSVLSQFMTITSPETKVIFHNGFWSMISIKNWNGNSLKSVARARGQSTESNSNVREIVTRAICGFTCGNAADAAPVGR